ncbi:angiotensin-converting enzyme-related protein-like [Anticarsia gemmatalis]|uniref:angiotensin-converting enzyme-related protein-like n=1 Tax=Anticarsia gemmatalis TaxID=129554 RepID=UPI003F76F91D
MGLTPTLFLLLFLKVCLSQNLENLFQKINQENGKLNAIAASIAWESSINPGNTELPRKSAAYQKKRIAWQHQVCNRLGTLYNDQLLNDTQKRQSYLLCRGPKFTFEEARLTSNLYEELQSIYANAEVCIPNDNNTPTTNLSNIETAILNYLSNVKQFLNFEHKDTILFAAKIAVNNYPQGRNSICLKGENDFEKIMEFSRNENVLRWLWLAWRERVGPPMKEPYKRLAHVENQAARRNGYPDIGASWRDELELPRLRRQCRHLYHGVQPLYKLLHGVVRYYLRRVYGDVVPERGAIPAHLLGNLWSQNWEPLADMMLPKNIDLDKSIKESNWTVMHMVKRAEDFYQSLGLPAMTDKFWRESKFTRENNDARCHGTAADMFQNGDYRLLYCAETSKEDFYVLHHELGHIQYYMAYEQQPSLFRQANSALHETIGDTIMYGVLTPQHLNRLGLINDSLLYTPSENNPDEDQSNTLENLPEDLNENSEEKSGDKSVDISDDMFKPNDSIEKELNTKDTVLIENPFFENYSQIRGKNKFQTKGKNRDFKPKYGVTYPEINNYNNNEITNNIFDKENPKNVKQNMHIVDEIVPELFDSKKLNTDMILLFKQALNKIPQIPFALAIDEYRWRYFEGSLIKQNGGYWDLVEELQGVAPSSERGEEYFDVGAKFHVPDNTPYIRYFLSSFLQHQLFEKLCKAAVFGRRNADGPVPDSISLSRCDIYGSKAAGKVLKDLMSRGHSQHWSELLQMTTDIEDFSSSALNRYYRPLYKVLKKFVTQHRIPIGW